MSDVKTVIMNYAKEFDIPDIVVTRTIALYEEAKMRDFTDNEIETFINEDGIGLSLQKGDEFLDIEVNSESSIFTLTIEKGIGSEYIGEFIDNTDDYILVIGLLALFKDRDDFFEIVRKKNRG